MGHVVSSSVSYCLPDGRPLLADVSFRTGPGSVTALIGPNGTGKTTVMRIIAGEIPCEDGSVVRSGTLGVMPQSIGSVRDSSTVRDLLLSVSPDPVRTAAAALDAIELEMMTDDSAQVSLRYAHALADWADVDGYGHETAFDVATVSALGVPYDRAKYRAVTSLSGGEQKRLILELLLGGPDDVLLHDEPDNYLDVPAKQWLEERLAATARAVLLISHDRELLARAATRIVTLEPGAVGAYDSGHPDAPPAVATAASTTPADASGGSDNTDSDASTSDPCPWSVVEDLGSNSSWSRCDSGPVGRRRISDRIGARVWRVTSRQPLAVVPNFRTHGEGCPQDHQLDTRGRPGVHQVPGRDLRR